jgi:hypothetical protein
MKKNIVIFLLLMTSTSFGQQADSTQLKNTIAEFFGVFSEFDAKYMERTVVPEFELYDVGLVWNIDSVKTYITKGKSFVKRENHFDFIKFNFRENLAWASYWNTADFLGTDGKSRKAKWLESAIFEKRNGKWLILQLHSTAVKR